MGARSMKEQQLQSLYEQCTEEMKLTLKNMPRLVFGDGSLEAKVVLVGEAPGAREEEIGKPFVGQAGKNLDQFLEKAGINREELFVTNVVKYRPFRINPKTGNKVNRPPSQSEVEIFAPYLLEEIHIIQPEFIVTLGNTALRAVLDDKQIQIGERHGQMTYVKIQGQKVAVYPMYHPASVIYRRELESTYEEDLLHFRSILLEEEEDPKESDSIVKKKRVLSIYGGNNQDPFDPSRRAAEISISTLKELEVEVVHIDLNERQINGKELQKELKRADAIILSTTIQWMGMGSKLQAFLDDCWELQDPLLFQNKYSMVIVFSQTKGEGLTAEQITASWLYLGGTEGCRLTGYIPKGTAFEEDQSHSIEKKAELFYRVLRQKVYQFPHSNFQERKQLPSMDLQSSKEVEYKPERFGEQGEDFDDSDEYTPDLDELVSPEPKKVEAYAPFSFDMEGDKEDLPSEGQSQGDDILELTNFFKQKAQGKTFFDEIREKLQQRFSKQGALDIEASIQLLITGQEPLQMYIEIQRGTFTCKKGIDDSPTITVTGDFQELNHILEGYTTLQKTFLLGKMKAKGSLSHIGIFDKVFPA